jgi:prephenate dehydrogenase
VPPVSHRRDRVPDNRGVRIAFLGLGLIGGSVARALRERPGEPQVGPDGDLELVAWSPSGEGPARARAAGVIDAAASTPVEAVTGAALVVLGGPADAVISAVRSLGSADHATLDPNATVTDVASTKRQVVAAADEAGIAFVGGHPMAGRETSGFDAADSGLVVGRPWVVVPGRCARPRDVERVEWLARAVGAVPLGASADEHDAAVAAISGLPLVTAAALVEAVAGPPEAAWPAAHAHRLAASGWGSATRLARGDPAMGAALLATNATEVAAAIRALEAALAAWREQLEAGDPADPEAVRDRLARARTLLAADGAAGEGGDEAAASADDGAAR